MDSSPDLSLKLRRGSSDSRDSFYMDFAQGIDSDIDDVVTLGSNHKVTVNEDEVQETDEEHKKKLQPLEPLQVEDER